MKKQCWLYLFAFLGIFFILASSSLRAQRLTGTIRGTVRDEGGEVLPGVTVEIKSPALIGGVKSELTTASGVFLFPALPPGTYTISFSLSGFQNVKRDNIIVSIGKTTTVDVALKPATLEESVTVVGESPVVDVTKSGTTTTYDQNLLQNLPKTRFTYIDIMLWAPGVSANETQSEEWHSSLGSPYWSDNYLVDGLDTSFDYNGTTWVWNNPDIYQEGEVISIGAPAEYGDFQGAVVNVITKSGGNTYAGGVNIYTIPKNWVNNNVKGAEYPYRIAKHYDFSFDLAGPIKKDKIWFYSNYQHRRYDYSQLGTPPDYPTKSSYDRVFIKATYQLARAHKLVASYQYEWYDLPDVITPAQPYDACAKEPGWYHVPNLMLTSILSPNAVLELKLGGWYAHDEWVPMDGKLDEPIHYDGATGIASNGIWSWTKATATKIQASAALSYYADNFLKGNHDFKFGVQYTRGTYGGVTSYSGGVVYYDYGGYPYAAYFQNPYNYGTQVNKLGVFVDDSWQITDRLTLNLGLRFDHQDGDIWEVEEIDAQRNPTGKMIPGLSNVLVWNDLSPRLGFVYQLTSDRKTTLRATYGHYREGMVLRNFNRLSPSSNTVYAFLWNPDTSAYDIPFWSWDPDAGLKVGSNVKSSLCQQFSLGVSRELFADLALELTFVYKHTTNFLSWWNTSAQFEPVQYWDEYGGKWITVYNQTTDPSENILTLLNLPEYKQRYRGFFITIQKRLSHNWQMSSSLAISKAYGVSTSDQLRQGNFNGLQNPNDLINNTGWDGLLQSDRTYMFKLQGSYFLPYGFSLSVSYIGQSGKSIARTIPVTGMNQGAFSILAEPRGSKYKLDSWHMIDFRVEKAFNLTEKFGVKVALDVFNLLNKNTMIETISIGTSEEFMKPTAIVPPRRAQLTVRFFF